MDLPGDELSDDWSELNDLLIEIVRDCIDRNVVRAPHEHFSDKHIPSELKGRLLTLLRTRISLTSENTGQFSCVCSMDPPDSRFNEVEGILCVYWWDISEIDTKGPFMDSEEFQEFGTNGEAERGFKWDFREENGELHLAGSY